MMLFTMLFHKAKGSIFVYWPVWVFLWIVLIGIVLIRTNDYYTTDENLFSDKSKFIEIHDNPTPACLSSIQSYQKKLNNRKELNDEVFKKIRPQNAKLARTHGVPKVHKIFNSIPPFRSIIDTTRTTNYSGGKYL